MTGRKMEEPCWREMVWQRPFEIEAVHEMLCHLASHSPRGAIIFEARGLNGYARHHLGADRKHIHRIEEVCKAHGNIQFYDLPKHIRKPVSIARGLILIPN